MGALAAVSAWIPEDDVLLKNAIEAGASLESLAKGAVQFSRKFSIQELQERWKSLLYDPVISEEASCRMIDFEHSVITLTSKFNRAGDFREKKTLLEKRRSESVRTCYYALCKKIRHEPSISKDLSFLEDDLLPGKCMSEGPISDNFEFQESNLDPKHNNFEELLGDIDAAPANNVNEHGFHATIDHQDADNFAHAIDSCDEILNMHGGNEFIVGNDTAIEEVGKDGGLAEQGPLVPNRVMGNSLYSVDQINDDPKSTCPEFEANQVFNSQITEYTALFPNLEFSSPHPGTSVWRIDEGLATSNINDTSGGNNLNDDKTSGLTHDGDNEIGHVPENDVCGTVSEFTSQMPGDGLKSPTVSTEGYLVEITYSLLNDEPFFIDEDAKDVIDKSFYDGLSSLLLNSPNEANEDKVPHITEQKTSVSEEENLGTMSDACPGNLVLSEQTHAANNHIFRESDDVPISSECASSSQFPELINGRICCILNSEYPDIPCNDGVVLDYNQKPKGWGSSANPSGEGDRDLTENVRKETGQSNTPSQSRHSTVMPLEKGQLLAVGDCKVELEGSSHLDLFNPMNVGMDGLAHQILMEENRELTQENVDAPKIIQNHQVLNGEVQSMDFISEEKLTEPLTLNLEEFPVESDDDIPYFSDVEAMVLDMDLGLDDQDLCDWGGRYQDNEAKRMIIRLEQVGCSYMQRAIAAHGAFAVLYGCHSKHYIKKPEVLLGRATEDFSVDIDLGTKGLTNKISRRQAIINMDKDGSFRLKNLGKFSFSVNGKEVAPGQSSSIKPNCLIEIRGIPFIFEMNQTCVKKYLDRKGQNEGSHPIR